MKVAKKKAGLGKEFWTGHVACEGVDQSFAEMGGCLCIRFIIRSS